MSSLSSRTRPVIQPFSDSSCIRLSVRRKVDLPQPDGPMRACTRLAVKLSETPFTAVNLPYMAVSLSDSTRTRGGAAAAGAGSATGGGAICRAGSGIQVEPLPDSEARTDAQHEDHQDEHQGRGPGVAVPLVVGSGRIGEHREREGG